MKLTKKLQAEVLEAYHAYWDSYLRGDMETFASLLDEDCHIIGSTAYDVFDDKKSAVEFYTATAQQIAGKTEFRNRKITLLPYGGSVMVQELCDYYFLAEGEWNFYSYGRLSTLLNKKEDGWKIVHQHGSLPDARAEKGEQVATEKISQENRELREAVKRRTVEIEQKNRELKIEASLERVRAVAMGMHKPNDLLNICEAMFKELKPLGFNELRNALIHTFDDEQKYFFDYDYSDFTGGCISRIPYSGHPAIDKFIKEIRSADDAFTEIVISGKELEDWKEFRKINNEADDLRLDNIAALYYYFYSIGPADIGISTFSSISDDKREVLKRFRNVFDFAYKRYTDVAQAEAQAREAQIELALERVRARTMAMQKSDELKEVIQVVYEQFVRLNILVEHAGFIMDYKARDDMHIWLADRQEIPTEVTIPYFDSPHWNSFIEAKEKGLDFFANQLSFEEKNKFYNELFGLFPDVPEEAKQYYFDSPGLAISTVLLENVGLYIENFKGIPYTDEENNTLMRFGKVFQQAYTRFLDLQKAEAQAIEARIETALEKVRSRSLAMHKSDELQEVVNTLFERLKELDIEMDSANIAIFKEGVRDFDYWVASEFQKRTASFHMPYTELPLTRDLIAARESGTDFSAKTYSFEEKNEWFGYAFRNTDFKFLTEERKQFILDAPAITVSIAFSKYTGVQVIRYSTKLLSEKEVEILKRFSKVFEQAYTRFLDLQKAEAQAREAQIQLSLERIRAKAMSMHRSEELDEVLTVLFEQFDILGITPMSTHMTLIDLKTNTFTFRETGKGGRRSFGEQVVAIDSMDIWKNQAEKWRTSEPLSVNRIHFPRESLPMVWQVFHQSFASMPDDAKIVPEDYPDGIYHTAGNCKFGYIGMNQTRKATEEEEQIVVKFATEFGRFYQRFLDLQKAEAQTREAQIEASLERVRAKAMAMHKSEDLNPAVVAVFEELDKLNLGMLRCGIGILDKEKRTGDVWTTSKSDNGNTIQVSGDESLDIHPLLRGAFDAWQRGEDFSYELKGEDLISYYRALTKTNFQLPASQSVLTATTERQYYYVAPFDAGTLFAFRETAFPEEAKMVMKRFAGVFNLTYKRFLDLQKAEAQAKESLIQLALERVRAKTIAMQKSDELLDVINVVSQQLLQLGFKFDNVSLGINNQHYDIDFWMSAKGLPKPLQIHSPYIDNPLVNRIIEARKQGLDFFSDTCTSEENRAWIHHTIKNVGPNVFSEPIKQFLLSSPGYSRSTALMEDINFFIGNYAAVPYTEEENNIFRRFAKVIGQSYTRFLDLQKAESQAKEAKIEAALERVRSRTLAMHKSEELSEAATVVFKQLIGLGVTPSRLFIGIIKDEGGEIEYWITDEHGSKVTKQFTGNAYRNEAIKKTFDGWKDKRKTLIIEMQGEELQRYFHYLNDELNVSFKDVFSQKRRVQNIAYFGNGFIGIASPDDQPVETLQLLERFAAVFNLTFTRFNDLKLAEINAIQAEEDLVKLHTEKRRAEDALKGLRAAQAQLIQSEKMASLGELTAGIAHEIQNPLNFVNNFSEINKEMLIEMEEEIAKGNYEVAKAIAKDVTSNQEKINFHGRRADAIVKGMLQHSRKSSGQKELTDINDLADEYLRLAYHGLRAKDKSFNAKFEMNFDPALEKINVIPQDMGRVILNLINNAFYTVSQKQKQNIAGYEPTVIVSTSKKDNQVLISVRDNGNGISPKVLDKIFQPFFTTKPTGQGTGLGLSLSYDIVTKAHGGELKVETKEGEGSEFIVALPA